MPHHQRSDRHAAQIDLFGREHDIFASQGYLDHKAVRRVGSLMRPLVTLGDDSRSMLAAYDGGVSQAHQGTRADGGPATIEELARAQQAEPVADPGDLAAEICESDAELQGFLADLRASRNASLT